MANYTWNGLLQLPSMHWWSHTLFRHTDGIRPLFPSYWFSHAHQNRSRHNISIYSHSADRNNQEKKNSIAYSLLGWLISEYFKQNDALNDILHCFLSQLIKTSRFLSFSTIFLFIYLFAYLFIVYPQQCILFNAYALGIFIFILFVSSSNYEHTKLKEKYECNKSRIKQAFKCD